MTMHGNGVVGIVDKSILDGLGELDRIFGDIVAAIEARM